MTSTGLITAIVIGAIIGVLGRIVVPGRQRISLLVTVIVGIIAALLGTALANMLSPAATVGLVGLNWVELLCQVLIAALGVALVSGRKRSRFRSR